MEISEKVVYLDNAATTACAPEVLAVMTEALSGACGNPSSHYSVGYEAKEFVDTGRAQVAKAVNAAPAEIFFTGCGSEADNWAVKGTAFTKARQGKKHLITSAFEHHAIMHSMASLERMGFEVTYIKPTSEGYIRPEDVEAAIRPDTALVSIMMANNEIGTIQPIKEIAEIAHKHGVWMHTDAVQAVGAIPVDVKELGVDMLSMSAHKFNGPKGMGALYCKKGVWPQNLIDGGSQEARHRAGTENVAGIAGMGKALELATADLEKADGPRAGTARLRHRPHPEEHPRSPAERRPDPSSARQREHQLPQVWRVRPSCWTSICTTSAPPPARPATPTALIRATSC